jgi:hypothetical protein
MDSAYFPFQNKYMQFYNKTSFRDARQDAHYVFLFFLESRNQVFAFVKEPPECDSLICCCIDKERRKQYCHLRKRGSSIVSSKKQQVFFEFRFVFQHE